MSAHTSMYQRDESALHTTAHTAFGSMPANVSLSLLGGALNFYFPMTPAQARALSADLAQLADSLEPAEADEDHAAMLRDSIKQAVA